MAERVGIRYPSINSDNTGMGAYEPVDSSENFLKRNKTISGSNPKVATPETIWTAPIKGKNGYKGSLDRIAETDVPDAHKIANAYGVTQYDLDKYVGIGDDDPNGLKTIYKEPGGYIKILEMIKILKGIDNPR